jgi:glutaredoxin
MTTKTLILYVKAGCPWCWVARDYLQNHGYQYELIDVSRDRTGFEELRHISGQTFAPTLAWDNLVLSDFGPEELEEFLEAHNIKP